MGSRVSWRGPPPGPQKRISCQETRAQRGVHFARPSTAAKRGDIPDRSHDSVNPRVRLTAASVLQDISPARRYPKVPACPDLKRQRPLWNRFARTRSNRRKEGRKKGILAVARPRKKKILFLHRWSICFGPVRGLGVRADVPQDARYQSGPIFFPTTAAAAHVWPDSAAGGCGVAPALARRNCSHKETL